jgi:hypothetical protein
VITRFSAVLRITHFLFGLAFMAQVQDVVLTSWDGSIKISRTLLGSMVSIIALRRSMAN